MSLLQFDFDAVKLAQALAFLAFRVSDMTKLKAAKLLYFADKQHLVKYGRPITGDRYYCLDHGPVPSASLNAINDLLTPVRIRPAGKSGALHMTGILREFLQVDRKGGHPRLQARVSMDELNALTETEREVLDATIARYGKLPAGKLIDLTHREKTWHTTNSRRVAGSSLEIPWELFLEDDVSPDVRDHIADHQEADAFLRAATRAARR